MREYRQKQREIHARHDAMRARPKVYVVSKYAGDVEKNVEKAKRYCRYVVKAGKNPIASHLLYPQFMDDNSIAERELGLMFGQALMALCQEVWVFGTEYGDGMKAEIHEAKRLKKRILYFNERMEKIHENGR